MSWNQNSPGLGFRRAWQGALLLALAAFAWLTAVPEIGPGWAAPNDAKKTPAKPAAKAAPGDADVDPEHPFPKRAPAPSLDGGLGWINTGGPLDIKDLKGKFILLDFWTYCCINCMHILPELKKLEHKYPNELVVIGVHSAKFETEKDSQNIRDAVLRYEIEHPVVNDANHAIWSKYNVSSWPSLRVIDPAGNIVAGNSGEIKFEDLDAFFQKVLPYYRKKNLLDETPLKFDMEAAKARRTPLRFPGKVYADEAGNRLFIADSNHNRIVITDLEGKLLETIGTGAMGRDDGDFATATFDHPQGMVLDGDTLYVADTENHLLRKVDLKTKTVKTIAGTGVQATSGFPGLDELRANPSASLPDRWVGPPLKTALNSPWDVLVHDRFLYIAMAGPHQIWRMPLTMREIGPYAGNGREDIVDGPLLPKRPYEEGFSSFAQPSGLASDGESLFVADSEGSSIRAVPFNPKKHVSTVIGTSELQGARLFVFGDRDEGKGRLVPAGRFRGDAKDTTGPLLQHALGVVFHEGQLYVADTYNNKIKVVDPREQTAKTIAGTGKPGTGDDPAEFDEPAGITFAKGKLYVADTNNHLIRVVDLQPGNKVSTLAIEGLEPPTPKAKEGEKPSFPNAKIVAVDRVLLKPEKGKVTLDVSLTLPPLWKINPIAPQRYYIEVKAGKELVTGGAVGQLVKLEKPAADFTIELPVADANDEGALAVTLEYYYCQDGNEGLCKTGAVTWNVPLALGTDGKTSKLSLKHTVK